MYNCKNSLKNVSLNNCSLHQLTTISIDINRDKLDSIFNIWSTLPSMINKHLHYCLGFLSCRKGNQRVLTYMCFLLSDVTLYMS